MILAEQNDTELWQRVLKDDTHAFEQIVSRHQSAVSAVSYSCLGDFAASEDISQETFLVAWQAKTKLENASRLRAWLCGIARNLAKNHIRRSTTRREHTSQLAEQLQTSSQPTESEVESRAMESEEEALVWNTLESISENYREPLVLFYREGKSVSAIAEALDISEDAAKQRLSRGRGMLRESVANLVGLALEQSRPGKKFTAAVMATVATVGATSKTAMAGGTAVVATAGTTAKLGTSSGSLLGVAGGTGLLGAAAGIAGGLAGGWFGTWLPVQLAHTKTERELMQEHGRRCFRQSIIFALAITLGSWIFTLQGGWIIGLPLVLIASTLFTLSAVISTVRVNRAVREFQRQSTGDEEPNDSKLRNMANHYRHKYKGRIYRSTRTLLGIPLVDIQLSDPATSIEMVHNPPPPKRAYGWIAIGDRATGILFAYGNIARGLVAMGGVATGAVSLGGVAFGGIAIGGVGIGLLSIGGLALGVIGFGGLALGWQAAGGGAIAWKLACGGGAIAYEAAMGGFAMAKQFATGGAAFAEHANDEAAKAFIDGQLLKQIFDLSIEYQWLFTLGIVVVCSIPSILPAFLYRRVSNDEVKQAATEATTEPSADNSKPRRDFEI